MKNEKLLNYFLSLLMIFSFYIEGFSKEKVVESKWITTPIIIDGLHNDWGGDESNFEKKMEIEYKLKNDSDNLYVLFIFKEPKFLSSIDATGITLWFNPEGKKKKDFGIKFTKKTVTADELISFLEKQGKSLSEDEKNTIKLQPRYVRYDSEIISKNEKSSLSTISDESERPAFKSSRIGKVVIYEFRIPFKYSVDSVIEKETDEIIRLGFEWGGMTEEMRKEMAAQLGAEGTRVKSKTSSLDEYLEDRDVREEDFASPSLRRMRSVAKKYLFWTDVRIAQNR